MRGNSPWPAVQRPGKANFTLIEGAGGVHVPLNDEEDMLDLMAALDFPVLLVVGNKLGCINHALLTLDALAARGLRGTGMILCRTRPDRPEETCLLADNAAVLARKGAERGFPLLADLPFLPGLDAPSCGERESAWARSFTPCCAPPRAMRSPPVPKKYRNRILRRMLFWPLTGIMSGTPMRPPLRVRRYGRPSPPQACVSG